MPLNNLRGLKESKINWEEVKTEKNKAIIEFINNGLQHLNKPLTIDEFRCPLYAEDDWKGITTTELCESLGMNRGCNKKDFCLRYHQQKIFQEKFPLINWGEIWKNTEEETREARMIRAGTLIIPENSSTELSQEE